MPTVTELLRKSGAILSGHFQLSSGLHADTYFQMALVYQHPEHGAAVTAELAGHFAGETVDVVVGPALGGVLISYELGRILGTRTIFAEREDGAMRLRRGFQIKPGERVLVCEDVITTGGSVKEVLRLVAENCGRLVGVGCIVRRGTVDLGCRLEALVDVRVNNYPPADCPLCRENLPLVKPGSRKQPCTPP